MRRSIAWLRCDLRLADNRVLAAATGAAERAWPVFVVDPHELAAHARAEARVAWFAASVRALDQALAAHGVGLTVLVGPPERVLLRLAKRLGAEAVFAATDEDPRAIERDRRVGATLDLRLVDDTRLLAPDTLRSTTGEPYTTFGPFRRALDARLGEDAPHLTASVGVDVGRLAPRSEGESGPEAFGAAAGPHGLPEAGEAAATARLRGFVRGGLAGYADHRNAPALDTTSRLSPYLRVGAISVRAAWRAALNAEDRARERRDPGLARGASAWRRELAWREFFAHVLSAQPRLARESFRPELDGLAWESGAGADDALHAWREGRTGFPLVDAGMRQLVAEGWMHNRARLVTASFLVKDLGLDWRRGESVFMEHLLDADVSQNNGNWQWVAGVGTDAAPYFRVLNPTLQARRFDPDGAYVRRWLPELAAVRDEHILEPWSAALPPPDYPAPIVDHAAARQWAIARYAEVGSERAVARRRRSAAS